MTGGKNYKIISYLFLAVAAISLILYFAFVKDFVVDILNGTAPAWAEKITLQLYPRFSAEKLRFSAEMVQEMALQVFVRTSFICLLLGALLFFYGNSVNIKNKILAYLDQRSDKKKLKYWQLVFYTGIICLTYKWILYPWFLLDLAHLYQPISFYKLFSIPVPSATATIIILVVLYGSILCAMLNIFPLITSAIAALFFIYWVGFQFCFEKVNHGFALMSYGLALLPLQFYLIKKHKKEIEILSWPIQLIKVVVVMAYFLAGMEKVFYSKMEFTDPDAFRAMLYYFNRDLGVKIAQSDFLVTVLPSLTILLQVSFPLILLKDKLKWFILPGGLLFHYFIGEMFGFRGFLYNWGLLYIFFFDLSSIPVFFKKLFQTAKARS